MIILLFLGTILVSSCAPVPQSAMIANEQSLASTEVILPTQPPQVTPNPQSSLGQGFSTDLSIRSVPLEEFLYGGPPKGGIPAIDNPQFEGITSADMWLEEVEPLMVVAYGDEVKGYPIQVLIWHEIVNDEIDGKPFSITYCPLCTTSVVYERVVDGQLLDFGVSGRLRYSNMVMYDRQTESWWQQATGAAIVGSLTGKKLTAYPSFVISWGDYKNLYPQGLVLSRVPGAIMRYGENPFPGYDDLSDFPRFYNGPSVPDILPAMERVLLVLGEEETAAYPYSVLRREQVIMDVIDGKPVVIFWKTGTASALDDEKIANGRDVGAVTAFWTEVDGIPLQFSAQEGQFSDQETGSVWNLGGYAVSGPLEGKQLKPLVTITHFWFSTAAFYPEARLFSE
jgi:hypothetical protein